MKNYGWVVVTTIALALLAAGCEDNANRPTPSNNPTPEPSDTAEPSGAMEPSDVPDPSSDDPLLLAAQALGGQEILRNLTGLEITASGEQYLFGESFEPVVENHLRGTFNSTLTWDLEENRLRQDWERDIDNFGFPTALSYREVVWGQRGTVGGCDSVFTLCSRQIRAHRQHAIRKHQYLVNPHILIKRALDTPEIVDVLEDQEIEGTRYHTLEITLDNTPFLLQIDATTGEIARVSTREIEPILGDVVVEANLLDWDTTESG